MSPLNSDYWYSNRQLGSGGCVTGSCPRIHRFLLRQSPFNLSHDPNNRYEQAA